MNVFRILGFVFLLLFGFVFVQGCDDGDVIVTDFSFNEEDLDLCEVTTGNYIYFKINNDTGEAISFNFSSNEMRIEDRVFTDTIALTGSNRVIYRKLDTDIDRDYYCGNIPPSNVSVIEEFVSSGGSAIIRTEIIEEDDNDGVIELDRTADFDGDGIPDFKDQDDDNDHVLTISELEDDRPRDTDGDGNADHVDMDDDGDDVLTKYEDSFESPNGNPLDDRVEGSDIPNFLNSAVALIPTPEQEAAIDSSFTRKNQVQTTFRTTITFRNLVLNGLDERIVNENLQLLGVRSKTVTVEGE